MLIINKNIKYKKKQNNTIHRSISQEIDGGKCYLDMLEDEYYEHIPQIYHRCLLQQEPIKSFIQDTTNLKSKSLKSFKSELYNWKTKKTLP